MVSRIRSKRPASFLKVAFSEVRANSWAPSRRASASLDLLVESMVTSQPSEAASLTAMWPSPPRPTTPIRCPGPAFQCRSGDQVVMPAHSKGAAPARSSLGEIRRANGSVTTTCFE
jgi:hypothetical protein